MKENYRRRADYGDMPMEVRLGILQTELDEYKWSGSTAPAARGSFGE